VSYVQIGSILTTQAMAGESSYSADGLMSAQGRA
jgi:hypothetical protein